MTRALQILVSDYGDSKIYNQFPSTKKKEKRKKITSSIHLSSWYIYFSQTTCMLEMSSELFYSFIYSEQEIKETRVGRSHFGSN